MSAPVLASMFVDCWKPSISQSDLSPSESLLPAIDAIQRQNPLSVHEPSLTVCLIDGFEWDLIPRFRARRASLMYWLNGLNP